MKIKQKEHCHVYGPRSTMPTKTTPFKKVLDGDGGRTFRRIR